MKQSTKNRRIFGIFYDKDNHPYFYQSKSKTAYFIPEKELKLAAVVAYRHWIALSVGVVLFSIFPNDYTYPIAVSALLFVALEWFYRQKMMPKYRKISPYHPHLTQKEKELMGQKTSIVLMKIVIYLTASGLLVWSIIDQKNEGASLAVLVAMVGVSLLSAIQYIIVLYKKR
ncbi:MAG: hypothetical protein HGA35_06265 [Erysipelotrichaceae bacterium]|nr:hypothetical protein [Erysipelotrichaceae bacterium]